MATRAIRQGKNKRKIPDLLPLGNTHICSCNFAPRKTLPVRALMCHRQTRPFLEERNSKKLKWIFNDLQRFIAFL